jgi:hypothetical protein
MAAGAAERRREQRRRSDRRVVQEVKKFARIASVCIMRQKCAHARKHT